MKCSYSILALSLGTVELSTPLQSSAACPAPRCRDIVLPIKAAANNTVFPPYPKSTAPGVMYEYLGSFDPATLPTAPVSGTFAISTTYCEPSVKVEGREGTIQFLLHGLSATKKYWSGMDFPESTFEGEYSWVHHAASQGYATLAIDNLGNGDSERPDPISVVQPALQLAVLYGILGGIRTGSLPNIPKYDKIIMASHSYGSVLVRLIATIFPTSGADAYVLTAASGDLVGIQDAIINFQARSASAVDFRYPNLPPAYVSVSKEGLRDTIYGLDGQFDPKMLEWDSASPHVFAVGEIAFFRPAAPTAFAGPVMILTGREDQIVCGNANITSEVPDCGVGLGSNPQNTTSIFPKASVFTAYVPDDTAHNINTQYTAPESFGAAHQWLQSVVLESRALEALWPRISLAYGAKPNWDARIIIVSELVDYTIQ